MKIITSAILNIRFSYIVFICAFVLAACSSPYAIQREAYFDYVAGQHAKFESNIERAADYYDRALEIDPQNEAILQEAFSLAIMDGQYDRAERLAERIFDLPSENATAAMVLALRSFKARKFGVVDQHLNKAIGTGFDSLVAPIVRAWAYTAQNKPAEAIEALLPLEETSIFKPFKDEQQAFIFDYLDMGDEAAEAYEAVLSNQRGLSVHPVIYYGQLLQRQGKVDEALALYQQFASIWPDNRRLKRAKDDLAAGIIISEQTIHPNEAIGMVLLRAASEIARDNARPAAILYSRLAAYMAPGRGDTLLLIASLFIAEDQPNTGLKALAQIGNDDLFADLARIRAAFALNAMGKSDEAEAELINYLSVDADNLDVRSSLGDLFQVNSEFEKAYEQYDIVIKQKDTITPEDWYVFFSRGISQERLGQWDDAEADFLRALELKPDDPQVLNYLGYSWIDRGKNLLEARRMIESAVSQRPDDGAIVDSYGWVLYLMGEYEKSLEQMERAVELLPNDPVLNDHLGDVYWMNGRRIEARFQWNQALLFDPDEKVREALLAKLDLGLDIYQASLEN